MKCLVVFIIAGSAILGGCDEKSGAVEAECAVGSEWESNCHKCRCSDAGTADCVRIPDCTSANVEPIRCKPNSTVQRDCNVCVCLKSGLGLCTLKSCLGKTSSTGDAIKYLNAAKYAKNDVTEDPSIGRKVRGATQPEPPKTCQPGQEFRIDCNKCLCDNEGQDFSCTRNDCTAQNNNNNNNGASRRKRSAVSDTAQTLSMECIAGSVFERECNVCRCTSDGLHATCTMRRCGQLREPSQDNEIGTDSDPNFRCNPGEQFKRDCNDCSCSADGKSFFCTLRLCDRDLISSL